MAPAKEPGLDLLGTHPRPSFSIRRLKHPWTHPRWSVLARALMALIGSLVVCAAAILVTDSPLLLLAQGTAARTDPNVSIMPVPLPLQRLGVSFADPAFGSTVRRVSDASNAGGFESHLYSQLQAVSADDAYLLLTSERGYLVRRIADLSAFEGLDTVGWIAPRWHPTRASVLVHFDSNEDAVVRVQLTDLETLTTEDAFTLPAEYQYILSNESFDELSEDGRWLAGLAIRADRARVVFAVDLERRQLGATIPLPDLFSSGVCAPDPVWGPVEPDWIAPSPLGAYLVVQWKRDGTTRCSGLETFDIKTGAFVGRAYDGHQHGDLGVMPDGTEFFMTFELYHASGRVAIGTRTLPGTATVSPPSYVRVLDWGNTDHISCRGPRGTCLVTAGELPDNGWNPFENELFLQRTDGSVLRLVHHRSSRTCYWSTPRATMSRDGRYVVFSSDWGRLGGGSCADDERPAADPYIIDLS